MMIYKVSFRNTLGDVISKLFSLGNRETKGDVYNAEGRVNSLKGK
jgi:hypothetical protein